MNNAENGVIVRLTESINDLSVKFGEFSSELRTGLDNLSKTVNELSATNTKRLDKHSDELDEHSDRLTKLETFRESEEKSKARNLAIAVVIATLFSGAISTLLVLFLG